jgi:hypothetical protein
MPFQIEILADSLNGSSAKKFSIRIADFLIQLGYR